MFGNTDGTSAGRAHDQDAALGGFVQVDVVHAHAGAADGAQLFGAVEQIGSDFRRAANDQGIGIGDLRVQRLLRCQYDVPARLLLQQLHAAIADLVRYDNFHEPHRLLRVFPAKCKHSKVASPSRAVKSVRLIPAEGPRTIPSRRISRSAIFNDVRDLR
jgi:hypothetical protein